MVAAMAVHQPWMYSAEQRSDSRFPTNTFDPKAVTRASWEKQAPKPRQNGPYFSLNRHPDAHMVIGQRSTQYVPMSHHTKNWIKWLRQFQLVMRVIELNGALGVLVLMVLLTGMSAVKGWVLRIAPGILICHCVYAIYHLSRDAAGRTPSSSAAYQVFSAAADLSAMGFLAFAGFTTHGESSKWTNRLPKHQSLTEPLAQAAYYTIIGVGALHFCSMIISLWLAWAFSKINSMPPDMNPLEDNLTARPKHKKNLSNSTFASHDSANRSSTPLGDQRIASAHEGGSNRSAVPFLHTRENSRFSVVSQGSRGDFPSRQYQIVPGNSPRNSVQSLELKRKSRSAAILAGSSPEKADYGHPQASEGNSQRSHQQENNPQMGRFTEAWTPTDSLVSRTNQRRKAAAVSGHQGKRNNEQYSAVPQRYDHENSSDSEGDYDMGTSSQFQGNCHSQETHPEPLGSNPLASSRVITSRAQTPYYSKRSSHTNSMNVLSEMSSNQRSISNSGDIVDLDQVAPGKCWRLNEVGPKPETSTFYPKSYGDLKSTTPVLIGNNRKTSSGNDYDSFKNASKIYGRRNVSGKIAEEGRAGDMGSGRRAHWVTEKR